MGWCLEESKITVWNLGLRNMLLISTHFGFISDPKVPQIWLRWRPLLYAWELARAFWISPHQPQEKVLLEKDEFRHKSAKKQPRNQIYSGIKLPLFRSFWRQLGGIQDARCRLSWCLCSFLDLPCPPGRRQGGEPKRLLFERVFRGKQCQFLQTFH